MKLLILTAALAGILMVAAQEHQAPPDPSRTDASGHDIKLPNGKSQKDEMLKADHAKNIEDVRELSRLARELRRSIETQSQFVFSIDDLKKTEEIEKLAKRIRTRMKHY